MSLTESVNYQQSLRTFLTQIWAQQFPVSLTTDGVSGGFYDIDIRHSPIELRAIIAPASLHFVRAVGMHRSSSLWVSLQRRVMRTTWTYGAIGSLFKSYINEDGEIVSIDSRHETIPYIIWSSVQDSGIVLLISFVSMRKRNAQTYALWRKFKLLKFEN